MTNKKISFAVEDFDFIDENPTSQFATATVQAFSSDLNLHDMFCSEEVLVETAPTIYGKPILYNVDKIFDDLGTHVDPDKTLIAGFVVEDSAEFKRLDDNRLSLNVVVKIWKRYAPKFVEILKESLGFKKVSVEMDLLSSDERDDGIIEMRYFEYSGICVLGDMVREASPGASLQVLQFSKEKEEYKKAYQSEFSLKYDDVDFTIPEKVKKNAQMGLDLYKQYSRGANSVALATARHLSKNIKSNSEKIRHIAKNHNNPKFSGMTQNPPSDEYITWMLYGSEEGKIWSQKVNDELDTLDKKQLSYYSENVTFPYEKREDMNPALKGIDPPISKDQGEEIAKQADSIGSDDKRNGWAIAISSFKKTHTVKDGRWVKKEKLDMNDENNMEEEMASVKLDETQMDAPETPADEKKEDKEGTQETPEEEKKEEMSLDANLDVAAILAMLSDETEDYKNVAEEFAKPVGERNFAKVVGAMYSKMCGMQEMYSHKFAEQEEKAKAYMAENDELKKFKADVEARDFEFEVNSTLKELELSVEVPEKDMFEMRERAKEFSINNITAWKNECKARAFSFAIKGKKEDGTKVYGLIWNTKTVDTKKSLWD